jgi:tryptophan-rich sensory protein
MVAIADFDDLDWVVVFIPLFVGMISLCLPGRGSVMGTSFDHMMLPGWVVTLIWIALYFLNGLGWAITGSTIPLVIVGHVVLSVLLLLWLPLFMMSDYYALYLLYVIRVWSFLMYTHAPINGKYCLAPFIIWLSLASQFNFSSASRSY